MADKKHQEAKPEAKPSGKPEAKPAGKPEALPKGKVEERKSGSIHFTRAVPASVEEVIGRTGTRGEATQVRCKIMDGKDQNKIMRRNVKGPVQVGDILMLRETEIEARPLSGGGRGKSAGGV